MINADATRRTTDSAFTGDRKEIAASLFRLGGPRLTVNQPSWASLREHLNGATADWLCRSAAAPRSGRL